MDHMALRQEVTRRSQSGKKCVSTICPEGDAKIQIHAELEGEDNKLSGVDQCQEIQDRRTDINSNRLSV